MNYSKSFPVLTSQINSQSHRHGDKWGLPLLVTSIRDLAPTFYPRKILYQVRLEGEEAHVKKKKSKTNGKGT